MKHESGAAMADAPPTGSRMTARVERLRRQSLETKPWLSVERARLLTAFCQTPRAASIPVERAMALEYLMEHATIYIGEGELIVGERGPAPKGAPTYPELCCHTLDDLEVLDGREKIAYAVDESTRREYRDTIIPFWRGRSMRDRLFAAVSDDWKAAYEAGVSPSSWSSVRPVTPSSAT